MPGISSTGLGSGLDVAGLVEKLVAAEGDPVTSRLNRKEADFQLGLSAIGTFKSTLADFKTSLGSLRSPDAFHTLITTSSDADILDVSATNNAIPGHYDISVTQLAQAQKLNSSVFESILDNIGSGKISIEFGTFNQQKNIFEANTTTPIQRIEIDSENSSLSDIQESINNANIGVRASIINDGSGHRLVISSEKTGLENSLRISVQDNDGNDRDTKGLSFLSYDPVSTDLSGKNMVQAVEARNAVLDIDGISISSASNVIKDPIPGITLTAKNISETAVAIDIEKDDAAIKTSVQNFVTSYNELMTTVSTLTGFDAESGESGPLSGDASIRGTVNQLRRALSTSFNGVNENLTSLSSIGIDTNRDGSLSLDDYKLDRAISRYGDEVVHLFSAVATTSDKNITVSSEKIPTLNGVFDITLSQVASKGVYRGLVTTGFPLSINDDSDNFQVKVDNVMSGNLSLAKRIYANADELATEIARVINIDSALRATNTSVTVDYVNNAFEIKSAKFGTDSNVAILSVDNNLPALLGLIAKQGTAGNAMQADVTGFDSDIAGTQLKLKGELDGISLDIRGSKKGSRGQLVVTNGIAALLDDLINSYLSSNGILDTKISGYNSKIKDITDQRLDLVRKLEVSEQRYLKQFTNLDAMLGKMRSTSNFLGNQLSSLPAATKPQN